jgi:signal transduction histidine kinase
LAAPEPSRNSLKIHQDVKIFGTLLQPGQELTHPLAPGRHAWVQIARGQGRLNQTEMKQGDGAAVSDEGSLTLKANEPLWVTWRSKYLWTSITYFGGASAAGITVKLTSTVGLYALVAAAPIIVIIYLTYRTYLKSVETSAAQAEQAERERMREHYAQMEKLSALGELASGVAHNFNNTLTGILARAQLMLDANAVTDLVYPREHFWCERRTGFENRAHSIGLPLASHPHRVDSR